MRATPGNTPGRNCACRYAPQPATADL